MSSAVARRAVSINQFQICLKGIVPRDKNKERLKAVESIITPQQEPHQRQDFLLIVFMAQFQSTCIAVSASAQNF